MQTMDMVLLHIILYQILPLLDDNKRFCESVF